MDNSEYILAHRTDDVRALALRSADAGVDKFFCLSQIEAWQAART